MRRFRRFRLPFLAGWFRWTVLLLALSYLIVRLGDVIIVGPMTVVAENEARLRGIDAMNNIVLQTVGNSFKADDLVAWEKDKNGNIAAYHINTQLVNQVAFSAAKAVHDEIRKEALRTFDVPLGAFTGSKFLATLGPHVPVRMTPVGSVIIDIKQEFKSEGINQTRHSITLHATARVQVILPMVSREIQVTSDMPVTDTVILGPVPQTLASGSIGNFALPANK